MKAGFALPAVLVITGVTCLALLAAVTAVESLARSAHAARDGAVFEAAALDLEARATLQALTLPTTSSAILVPAGRAPPVPLRLDGTRYAAGDLELALQDEAGLINLNTLPSSQLPRLVEQFGVPAGQRTSLAARLADYLDIDDRVRPGGAESGAYLAARRPPPPNGPLRARADILGVLGWDEAAPPGAWRTARALMVTDSVNVGVNINTTPPDVLEVRYGLTPAQAAKAVARRRLKPFETVDDLGRAAGVRLIGDAERSDVQPSGRLQFTAAAPASGRTYASRIVLTPTDAAGPFRIEDRAVVLLPVAKPGQAGSHAVALPVARD
ncbi:MAG: hypothetical protein V4466_05505 [Pseudomonadota bacterium]